MEVEKLNKILLMSMELRWENLPTCRLSCLGFILLTVNTCYIGLQLLEKCKVYIEMELFFNGQNFYFNLLTFDIF